jgi:hypothetical protein
MQRQSWSQKILEEKKRNGLIRGFTAHKAANKKKTVPAAVKNRSDEKAWLGWNLLYWCNDHAVQLVPEYQFHRKRKFRFDWAIPALKIAIEYEGLMSEKSGHTTIAGYTKDTTKYNLAQQLGWKVIRVTALNYKTVLETLNSMI